MASQKHSFFRRILSLATLTIFVFTNHFHQDSFAYAAAVTPPLTNVEAKNLPRELSAIQLPARIGRIQESYQGSGNQTVILVQDAHAIPDAQKNIQRIISYFQKNYGVRSVALEGASSKLDPQIFKSFPDQKLLRKVFNEYLQ